MLRSLFSRGPKLEDPALDTDRALDDLELRAARAKAEAGDWTAARDVVAAAGTDWERRGNRIGVLSEAAADDLGWLDGWLDASPDDPAAAAIEASALGERAGRARGAAPAANTTQQQFQGFAELSARAARASRRAVELAPGDPVPYAQMLRAMFADGHAQQAEFAEAFAAARRCDPTNLAVNLVAVSFYCEKWYGSHERMFAVAREAADLAAPGTAATTLPLFAHFEYAMREFNWGRGTAKGFAASQRYFQRPEVRAEVDACAAKWRAAGPPTHASAMVCRNWLALAYSLAERRAEAKAMFDEIGPYANGYTWGYFYGGLSRGFVTAWRWANGGR